MLLHRRLKTSKKGNVGAKGEEAACRWLEKQGYRILTRNYRRRIGEIDIVAKDGETLAFIEVKTRTSLQYGSPLESIDLHKQKQISRVALDYLSTRKIDAASFRFDVVAVRSDSEGFRCELIKNAFEAVE